MDWNYYNTFITIAEDCPVEQGKVPPDKKSGKTKAGIEFELAFNQPYAYTQEELMYEVHIRHNEFPEEQLAAVGEQIREEFFSKPKACMRASMLSKKFGWGIHFNAEGKLALVPMESAAYREFVEGKREEVKLLRAMRSSRNKSRQN